MLVSLVIIIFRDLISSTVVQIKLPHYEYVCKYMHVQFMIVEGLKYLIHQTHMLSVRSVLTIKTSN